MNFDREVLLIVQGTFDRQSAAVENMCIDHGGFDILMTQQFLDCADIVAGFKQVGGEAVTEDMRRNGFVYFRKASGTFYSFLQV